MYSKKNVIFILIIIFLLLFIAIFNYKINTFSLFSNKYIIAITNKIPSKLIYPYIQFHKKDKCDLLSVGTSESRLLFSTKANNSPLHRICAGNIDEHVELLKAYVDAHPEMKHVYICLNPNYWNKLPQLNIEPYKKKKITFSDYASALFYLPPINIYLQKELGRFSKKSYYNYRFCTEYSNIAYFDYDKTELLKNEEKYFNNIKQMVDLLKAHNISYSLVILPINAAYIATMRQEPVYKDIEARLKRFLVSISQEVYDFSFINKFTSIKLTDKSNCIWLDYSHCSDMSGLVYFEIIFDKKNKDNDLYFVLNKYNVDKIIAHENKLTDEYYNQNKKYIDYYHSLASRTQISRPYSICSSFNYNQVRDFVEKHMYNTNEKVIGE